MKGVFMDKSVQLFRFKITPPDDVLLTEFHQHEQGSLFIPIFGNLSIHLEDHLFISPKGCSTWIPARTEHRAQAIGVAEGVKLFVNDKLHKLPDHPCSINITELSRALIRDLSSKDDKELNMSFQQMKIKVLIKELEQSIDFNPYSIALFKDHRIQFLYKEMMRAPEKKIPLKVWANQIGMSERNLSRLIKKDIGMTFSQWKNQLYMFLALKELLRGKSIQNISINLGYESDSSFIYQFKKTFGNSPMQYLKKQNEKYNIKLQHHKNIS